MADIGKNSAGSPEFRGTRAKIPEFGPTSAEITRIWPKPYQIWHPAWANFDRSCQRVPPTLAKSVPNLAPDSGKLRPKSVTPGRPRPKNGRSQPKRGRHLANIGQHRPTLGRIRPNTAQARPKSDRCGRPNNGRASAGIAPSWGKRGPESGLKWSKPPEEASELKATSTMRSAVQGSLTRSTMGVGLVSRYARGRVAPKSRPESSCPTLWFGRATGAGSARDHKTRPRRVKALRLGPSRSLDNPIFPTDLFDQLWRRPGQDPGVSVKVEQLGRKDWVVQRYGVDWCSPKPEPCEVRLRPFWGGDPPSGLAACFSDPHRRPRERAPSTLL